MTRFVRYLYIYMVLLGSLVGAVALMGAAAGGPPALLLLAGFCAFVAALGVLGLWSNFRR